MKKVSKILFAIGCIGILMLLFFIKELPVAVKVIFSAVYCVLCVCCYIKDKKYKAFGSKVLNIIYGIFYIYFDISLLVYVWLSADLLSKNTAFFAFELIVIGVLAVLSYFAQKKFERHSI